MNARTLNEAESQNLAAVNDMRCENVLLFLTETGLHKSILDATEPIRRLMRSSGFHDFSSQAKGPSFKVIKRALLIHDTDPEESSVSLYRPMTKDGDPRLWVSALRHSARPGDVCAAFIHDDTLCLVNLSQSRIARDMSSGVCTSAVEFLHRIGNANLSVAEELLGRLREISASGPIPATCKGSTAIGRAIESALGIPINSSPNPDFKGIEIKSGRCSVVGRQNRATLFACVPDWTLSSLNSSAEILQRFGYMRGSVQKLYCTVSTREWNSQGLRLAVDYDLSWLREICGPATRADVCVWPLTKLHGRLQAKHRETFWIRARPMIIRSREHFKLESVTHTSRPSIDQFDRLLEGGTVTVDHLIKRKSNGSVNEKGPLFKVQRPRLHELFLGAPRTYSLSD